MIAKQKTKKISNIYNGKTHKTFFVFKLLIAIIYEKFYLKKLSVKIYSN